MTMLVLDALWNGNVAPSVRAIREGSQYKAISEKLVRDEDALRAMLNAEGKKLFEQIGDCADTMAQISEQDAFIKGFRLGARTMLDVLNDYPSPLPQIEGEDSS